MPLLTPAYIDYISRYIQTPEYIESRTKPRAVAKKEYIPGPGRHPGKSGDLPAGSPRKGPWMVHGWTIDALSFWARTEGFPAGSRVFPGE